MEHLPGGETGREQGRGGVLSGRRHALFLAYGTPLSTMAANPYPRHTNPPGSAQHGLKAAHPAPGHQPLPSTTTQARHWNRLVCIALTAFGAAATGRRKGVRDGGGSGSLITAALWDGGGGTAGHRWRCHMGRYSSGKVRDGGRGGGYCWSGQAAAACSPCWGILLRVPDGSQV